MEFSTPNLAELEQILTNLFSQSGCNCHFLNPHKTKIILWLEKRDNQIIYHLCIGLQRFKSWPLTDKNGDPYWRFWFYPNAREKDAEEKETKFNHSPNQVSNKQSAQLN